MWYLLQAPCRSIQGIGQNVLKEQLFPVHFVAAACWQQLAVQPAPPDAE